MRKKLSFLIVTDPSLLPSSCWQEPLEQCFLTLAKVAYEGSLDCNQAQSKEQRDVLPVWQ